MGKKNYLDNKRFEEIISLYRDNPKIYEDELIELFDILITNIIEGFKFSVDKDDAKQDCYLLIIKTLKNFKGEKGTAFNYFTTVIVNNLKLIYTKNKKRKERHDQYIETITDKLHPNGHK
jgi:DNA-directed RNA polymerase specialized sigma subunit